MNRIGKLTLLFFVVMHIFGMEPEKPPRILPACQMPDVSTQYAREKRRLESYKMESPNFFDWLIKKEKFSDPMQQITAWSLFLKALSFQHIFMRTMAQYNRFAYPKELVDEERERLVNQIGTLKISELVEAVYFSIYKFNKLKTSQAQNFVMYIAPLLQVTQWHLVQAQQVAKNILLDGLLSSNKEMVIISKIVVAQIESSFFVPLVKVGFEAINALILSNIQNVFSLNRFAIPQFCIDNLLFASNTLHAFVEKSQEFKGSQMIGLRYNKKLLDFALLYEKLQPYYIQLYDLFYKQLKKMVLDPELLRMMQAKNVKIQELFLGWKDVDGKQNPLPQKLELWDVPQDQCNFLLQNYLRKLLEERTSERMRQEALEKQKREQKAEQRKAARKEELEKGKQKIVEPSKEVFQTLPEKIPTPVITATDSSFVQEETEVTIIIQDPKNSISIELIKRLSATELQDLGVQVKAKVSITVPLTFSPNVLEWFENPQQALANQGYLDPAKARYAGTPEKQKEMIVYHSFAKVVDDFIVQNGFQTHTASRLEPNQQDILISVPGSIEMNGKQIAGLFTYLINAKGICYHRMFTPESFNKQMNDLLANGLLVPEMKEIYEVHFPPLGAKK